MTGRPAAFLDRDGVLNADHGYVSRAADFHWLPGAISALARLQRAGCVLVVVTNQSGIGRGFYSQQDFDALTRHMLADLAGHGVAAPAVYACPHHPQALLAAYRRDCDCRKPRPGMLLQAAADLQINLAASCLFGDKPSDIAAGRAAGVRCCLLIAPDGVATDPATDAAQDATAGRAGIEQADGQFASLHLAVGAWLASRPSQP